jgi:hypothetical protein
MCVSTVPKLFSGNDELFCETKYLDFFVTVSYILPSLRCTLLPYLIRRYTCRYSWQRHELYSDISGSKTIKCDVHRSV